VGRRKHNNIETRVKNFLLHLCIVDFRYHHRMFWENPIGLQRLSPKGGTLSYASPPAWKLHPHSDINSKLYKPTFLATHLIAVLQPSRYSVFHGGDILIQLGLP